MSHHFAQAAEMRLGAPEEELPAFRRHPLGQDSQGFVYWVCDWWETAGARRTQRQMQMQMQTCWGT